MQPRSHHRPARSATDLLPPLPRDRRRPGPPNPDLCLRRGSDRFDENQIPAGSPRGDDLSSFDARPENPGGLMKGLRKISASPNERDSSFDVEKVRKDFPVLHQRVNGKPLVYLDNAATSQKPEAVIKRLEKYYREENANIHRGVHMLSEKATDEYEKARHKIQHFLNAREAREILFVRGTTEAINLVAQTFGRQNIRAGDEILISTLEHHSNIVPWQMLCQQNGAKLRVIPINDAGELLMDEFEKLLNEKTKLVAVGHISNALGTINPIEHIIERAHRAGAKVLIDGA